jgi:hypothetical protein
LEIKDLLVELICNEGSFYLVPPFNKMEEEAVHQRVEIQFLQL